MMEYEDFVGMCLDVYDEQMEKKIDSAKLADELKCHHELVKTQILELIPSIWESSKGSPKIPDEAETLLVTRLESTFHKVLKNFEKSKKREKAKLAALIIEKDAIASYTEEMDKYFQNNPNTNPPEIEEIHAKVVNQVVERAISKVEGEIDELLIANIKQGTDHHRNIYYERALTVLKSNQDPAIGIDLGTTMCCVMVFHKGKCELVPNRSQGNSHTTPSYVAFHENGNDTFGHVAKEEAYMYPETTIYDAKRMVGRPFHDINIQSDLKNWPFEVIDDNGNVKIKTWDRLRYPHEVSARLLTRFRLMAEAHLKVPHGTIKKAVITVPAYFTEPQRRATREAAACAGLQVLNILSEPTAAAIAYNWERHDTNVNRRVLIYDLGGGTFDVAIANVTLNNVEILCVDGDTHLGGQDFDQALMGHCIREFAEKENINLQLLRDSSDLCVRNDARRALSRLKLQCEKAKERLTTTETTTILVEKIYKNHDFCLKMTKVKLEQLVRHLVRGSIDIIERALFQAKSKGVESKDDIDDIIMVGGSTRMPLVLDMVSQFFGGKQLCKHIHPDEAVAHGAAIQAAILNKNDTIRSIMVQDVTPMSLGVHIAGDRFSIIVPQNTKIPCTVSKTYTTIKDNQTKISCKVYQGEHPKASRNNRLGKFTIPELPPGPAKKEKANVTMTFDEMGILHVQAVSITTGESKSIMIAADRMGIDNGTMERLVNECQQIKNY